MQNKEAKEMKLLIETRLGEFYATLQAGDPPKKIRKVFSRAAKKISNEIKTYLKAEAKREDRQKKKELKTLRKEKKRPAKKVVK